MKLVFELIASDVSLSAELQKQKDLIKQLAKELQGVEKGSEQYRELVEQITGARVEVVKLTKEQKALNREFQITQVPKDSLAGLRLEYSKLADQLARLTKAERESDFGKNLISKTAKIKAEINGIEESVGRFTGSVGNYRKAVLSLGDLVTGGLITGGIIGLVQGIISLGKQAIQINAQVSDKIADVAKAANVSIKEVERLADVLEKRKTRTSLLDQLGIAEIGGKLGVATEQLQGFVESVDVVNVALGDQFGGNVEIVTETIGKLRNVLLDVKTDNVGEDIVHIGNALNFLESQGAASAGTIADFTTRIAGIGQQFGVSSAKIIGVSATLDELGVNAERGSTGFIRILQRIAQAPEAFAKAIGEPAKEFKELVNRDIFGAATTFIGKLNDKNLSNSALETTLKALKVNGVGVTEVIGKLGGNLQLLQTRVEQSGTALKGTNSVTQEFEKKNATLGATVQNLSNAFSNLLTNDKVGGGLKALISGLVDFITFLNEATEKLFDFGFATDGASKANDILEDSLLAARVEIEKDSIATEKNFAILKDGRASREQHNKAIDDLVKLYPGLLTQQQLEKASNEELITLQTDLTTALRSQILERQKLRAKEAIETEIIQRRLRQVELDATPDRALLGELTAGETLRNFGIIDPAKLRVNIKKQVEGDIRELEAAAQRTEARFNAVRQMLDNGLSAEQQDQLDLERQFADKTNDTAKAQKDLSEATDKATASMKKQKEETVFAEGSLGFLRKQIETLRKELEKTPAKDKPFEGLAKQLFALEKQLAELEERLARLRAGSIDRGGVVELLPIRATLDGLQQVEDKALEVGDKIKKSVADANEKKAAQDKKDAEAEAKRQEDLQQLIKDGAFDTAQTVSDSLFEIRRNGLQREVDAELAALDEATAKKIEAAHGNQDAIAKIEKDAAKKRAAVEKEAARERKRLSIFEAIINTAVAVTKALTGAPPPANFILAGIAGIAGAAQIAVISSQKFARGGFTGRGKERDETGRRVAGVVHENEYVAPTTQIERFPMLFNFLENDRRQRQRRFAAGGFTSDFVPQIGVPGASGGPGVLQVAAFFTDEQMDALADRVATKNAEATAPAVKQAVGEGLNDANRRLEREAALAQNRAA